MEPHRIYKKDHCWQYDIRQNNLGDDLKNSNLTLDETKNLKISDFKFEPISKDNQIMCRRIKHFIERHEWLGKMPNRPTHRFIATYKGIIAGVIIMATPNSFSHLLGKENRNLEKLISRGACISWSPKNLGSALVMYSIRWMVQNTDFRYFTAYSDTEAKELGTIYQACNFIYLGKNSGAKYEHFDPQNPHRGWGSDRIFRRVGQYKIYAKNLGLTWQDDWSEKGRMLWNHIPNEYEKKLREVARAIQSRCHKRKVPRKHKYLYILGKDKKETRNLKKLFYFNNPELQPHENEGRVTGFKYPKKRGE